MESLYLVIGIAIAVWLITTKQFRKNVGSSATDIVEKGAMSVSYGMSNSISQSEVEFNKELEAQGLDYDKVKKILEDNKSLRDLL